jgi:DNA-binding XRE family transcriptional regulator
MISHAELKHRALSQPKVKAAYVDMQPEYNLLKQLLVARQKAGLSQAAVAELMGTQAPSVARLESALLSGKHSPSLATLRKYASAVGKRLVIGLA